MDAGSVSTDAALGTKVVATVGSITITSSSGVDPSDYSVEEVVVKVVFFSLSLSFLPPESVMMNKMIPSRPNKITTRQKTLHSPIVSVETATLNTSQFFLSYNDTVIFVIVLDGHRNSQICICH